MDYSSKLILLNDPNVTSNLRPITPAHSVRYSKTGKIELSHRRIPPGLYSQNGEPEPNYLPLGWAAKIQPEGQLYFYNDESHVVTESNIYCSENLNRITYWIKAIGHLALSRAVKLTSSVEIFLQLEEDAEGGCSYYLVDHRSRAIFWLHELSTEDFGIPESSSFSQLRWAFNEHYCTHVEYFPSHLNGIPMSWARELIGILTHASADHLTSTVGTFPYNATQCKEFVDLLRDHVTSSPETLNDEHIICIVARLWAQVARHRFLNLYGEENARLSRDQRLIDTSPRRSPLFMSMVSMTLLFNMPRTFAKQLDGLWIDNLVYTDPWKQFMARSLAIWKETAIWSMGMIFAHLVLYASSIGSSQVAIASLALSLVGLISSKLLAHYHQIPLTFEIADAADFLSQTYHPVFGFTPLSIVYSIPQALLFWSTGLVALQVGFALFRITDLHVASGLTCFALLAICVMVAVLRRGFNSELDVQEASQSDCWWRRFFRSSARRREDLELNSEKSAA